MESLAVYGGLFLAAFLAATIFPFQSELALAGLLISGEYPIATLITVASVGNTVGSIVNWFLGRGVYSFRNRSWFPVKPDKLDKAVSWYRRYGQWSLLLSWAPLIGDPLTVAAGVMREPFWMFLFLVAIAKTGRYLVVAAIALQWM